MIVNSCHLPLKKKNREMDMNPNHHKGNMAKEYATTYEYEPKRTEEVKEKAKEKL